MSYFKKFCDLVGGIGAFFASVYLIGRYMEYNPRDLIEGESKLSLFLSGDNTKEYRQYVIFIVLLFAAVLLGRLLGRYPLVTLLLSVLPLTHAMGMLWRNTFYSNAEFYIIVSAVIVCGNVYEACSRDRAEGTRGAFFSAGALGTFAALSSLVSIKLTSMASYMSERFLVSELTEADMELEERLSLLGIDLVSNVPEGEREALIFIAVALLVTAALSFALKNIYIIDVILAAVPFVYSIVALHSEKLSTAPMLVLVPTAVYFFCRVALGVRKE